MAKKERRKASTRSLKLSNEGTLYFFSEILALSRLKDCGCIPK